MPSGIYKHQPQQGFQKGHLLLGGGFSGHKHSEFTKRGMIIRLRANSKKFGFQKGYKPTEEHKRKLGLALKGRKAWNIGIVGISEETKKKMRLAKLGKPTWNKGITGKESHSFGRKPTEETIQKLRNACITKKFTFTNTSIELKLQNFFKEQNILFEINYPILGRPDIFIKPNICIFADGCYWHKCPECGYNEPIRREKDQRITQQLQSQGYIVIRLWEHEINKSVEECFAKIQLN